MVNKKRGDVMPWFCWLAAYLIIAAFVIFYIIPEKSILLIGACAGMLVLAWAILKFTPGVEKKENNKPPQ